MIDALKNCRRVMVTGGAGFLGSHVVDELARHGIPAAVPRSENLVDQVDTRRLFDSVRPDVVIHLAAKVGGIGANREHPGLFLYANAMMGLNVLEACRFHKVRKLVIAGTICAYPKHCPVPFKEDDLWNGYPEETNAPYGIAKKMLMAGAQAYRQEYDLDAISLLPVNLYGPLDNFSPQSSHVIPAMVLKFLRAKAAGETNVVLWGTGTPTREFLYVADCAEAIVRAADSYSGALPLNIGTGQEITIRDLANKIADACEYTGMIEWDTSKPDGQPRRCLDVSRARTYLGWEARTPFEVGLAHTVAYAEYELGRDPAWCAA